MLGKTGKRIYMLIIRQVPYKYTGGNPAFGVVRLPVAKIPGTLWKVPNTIGTQHSGFQVEGEKRSESIWDLGLMSHTIYLYLVSFGVQSCKNQFMIHLLYRTATAMRDSS